MIKEAIADQETMGLVEVFGIGAQGEEQETVLVVFCRRRRRCICSVCSINTSCSGRQSLVASISFGEEEFHKVRWFCTQMGYRVHLELGLSLTESFEKKQHDRSTMELFY